MRGRLSILRTANSRRDSSNSDRISTIDTLTCCARSGKNLRRRGRDYIHPQCPRRASRRRGDAPREILLHEVVQLGRELDAGGPPAHHHKVQQPLHKGLVVAGLRCRLKIVNNVPANALGVLDLRHPPAGATWPQLASDVARGRCGVEANLLQEVGVLVDAGDAEGVGAGAHADNKHVIRLLILDAVHL